MSSLVGVLSFLAIVLTLVAELAMRAIRLEPGAMTWGGLVGLVGQLALAAALDELIYRVLLLSGLVVVLARHARAVRGIGSVMVYLRRRWPDGQLRPLTYAPDPQPRKVS